MLYNYISSPEVKNQRALAKRTSQIMKNIYFLTRRDIFSQTGERIILG